MKIKVFEPGAFCAALAENERFKRHLAHYAQVIEDCQICCDPPATETSTRASRPWLLAVPRGAALAITACLIWFAAVTLGFGGHCGRF